MSTEYFRFAHFDNPEDHARGLDQVEQRYLQTGPGRFSGLLQQCSMGEGVSLYRERINVPLLQQGRTPADARTFVIPLVLERSATVLGRAVGTTVAHMLGGQEFVAQSATESDYAGIAIENETFASYADYLGGLDSLGWGTQPLLEAGGAALRRASFWLKSCLYAVEDNLGALAHEQARKAFRDDVVEQLLCLLIDIQAPRQRDVTHLTYSDIVGRSRDYLLAEPEQPVSVLDLCRALRVSRRTVQTAFLALTGVAPNVYLRSIRLSLVRRLLLETRATELSVCDAAARWGFVNKGKFAAEYRKTFGYLPSQTRRA
ncbi:hypothetical protein BJN34_11050 [Cupriavidus necator]|uniref:HTH araC/xylS-type domain-containing protein n=1 Tax=Cupriavidus necator TaxID=106590 RepID=A0A1U9UNX4_CUPNE|nr:helix-turn-helix domain-containing protein [Cupriavidus necator]AQV94424.1 hypothetical protein BJN34_11050 [Cupriavidus necator]